MFLWLASDQEQRASSTANERWEAPRKNAEELKKKRSTGVQKTDHVPRRARSSLSLWERPGWFRRIAAQKAAAERAATAPPPTKPPPQHPPAASQAPRTPRAPAPTLSLAHTPLCPPRHARSHLLPPQQPTHRLTSHALLVVVSVAVRYAQRQQQHVLVGCVVAVVAFTPPSCWLDRSIDRLIAGIASLTARTLRLVCHSHQHHQHH